MILGFFKFQQHDLIKKELKNKKIKTEISQEIN